MLFEMRGSSFGFGWGICKSICGVPLLVVEVVVSICGRGVWGREEGEWMEVVVEDDDDDEGLGTLNVPTDWLA